MWIYSDPRAILARKLDFQRVIFKKIMAMAMTGTNRVDCLYNHHL